MISQLRGAPAAPCRSRSRTGSHRPDAAIAAPSCGMSGKAPVCSSGGVSGPSVLNSNRPPGRSTLCTCANSAGGSSQYGSSRLLNTRSTDCALSGNAWAAAHTESQRRQKRRRRSAASAFGKAAFTAMTCARGNCRRNTAAPAPLPPPRSTITRGSSRKNCSRSSSSPRTRVWSPSRAVCSLASLTGLGRASRCVGIPACLGLCG